MTCRYQTTILAHTVTIASNRDGRYNVSIAGPTVTAMHGKSFFTLDEAKREVHAFAHTSLEVPCECDELDWRISLAG